MAYAVRLISAFGIASILSAGAFDLLPGQPPYRFKSVIIERKTETEAEGAEKPRIIARSTKCNGVYDSLEFIYSNGEISSPLGLRYPEYEDDLMRKVLEGGGDGDSIEFKNCGKPSRKKSSLVIPYT